MLDTLKKLAKIAKSLDDKEAFDEANIVDSVIGKIAMEMTDADKAQVENLFPEKEPVATYKETPNNQANRARREDAVRRDKKRHRQEGLQPKSLPESSTETHQTKVETFQPKDTGIPPRATPLPEPEIPNV